MALDVNDIPEIHRLPTDNGTGIPREVTQMMDTLGNNVVTQAEILSDIEKQMKKDSAEEDKAREETQKTMQGENSKSRQFFDNMTNKMHNFTEGLVDRNKEVLTTSLLGPMALITKPLEEFAGFSLSDTLGNVFKPKRSKTNPNESDVAKNGETGILFLWQKFKKLLGKEDEEGSLLDKLHGLGGAIGPIVSSLLRAGAIAAIVGGLIWAVVDGIKASMLAGEWGVSKISAFIGGFFGGTGSGFSGALKNMGKWALVGAGIGFLAGGPIGAIAGALLGAAIGAVIGYIGGEAIAQNIEGTKQAISEIWGDAETSIGEKLLGSTEAIAEFFSNGMANFFGTIVEMVAGIWVKDETQRKKIGDDAKKIFKMIFAVSPIGLFISDVLKDVFFHTQKSLSKFRESKGDESLFKRLFKLGGSLFIDYFQVLWGILSKPKLMQDLGKWIKKKAWPAVIGWFSDAFTNIGQFFGNISDIGSEFASKVITGITDWFLGILNIDRDEMDQKGFWGTLWDNTKDNIQMKIIDPLMNFFSGIGNMFQLLSTIWQQEDLRPDQKVLDSIYAMTGFGLEANRERVEGLRESMVDDVEDAIIKPDGSIIRTHPDDTIIATKNDPTMTTDSTLMVELINAVKAILKETVDIKNKPAQSGNTVSNSVLENMSKVRLY